VGRIYFNLPDGIKTGQYYLNVKFKGSVVQVPFRILTDEEQKEFNKSWKDMKKEHDAEYKQQ
jgi:ribosome recycling factor